MVGLAGIGRSAVEHNLPAHGSSLRRGRVVMKCVVVPFSTFVKFSRTPCPFNLQQTTLQLQIWMYCLSRSAFLREKMYYRYHIYKLQQQQHKLKVFIFICTGCFAWTRQIKALDLDTTKFAFTEITRVADPHSFHPDPDPAF